MVFPASQLGVILQESPATPPPHTHTRTHTHAAQIAAARIEMPLRFTLPAPKGAPPGDGGFELVFPPPPSGAAVMALAAAIVTGYNASLDEMGPELAAHRMVRL